MVGWAGASQQHALGSMGKKHGKPMWQGLAQGRSVEEQGCVPPTLRLLFLFLEQLHTKIKPSPGQAGSRWDAGSSGKCSSLEALGTRDHAWSFHWIAGAMQHSQCLGTLCPCECWEGPVPVGGCCF